MLYLHNIQARIAALRATLTAWLAAACNHTRKIPAALSVAVRAVWSLSGAFARIVADARQLWLFVAEVAGIVLVTFGISFWSVPAAIILGGLVLVAVVELRPPHRPMPRLPVPEVLLRAQAEQAARILNNAAFGVAEVDQAALDQLTLKECERLIAVARSLEREAAKS